MKKIIFIHLLNDFSGSPKVLSHVIKVAKDKGINVELFTGNKTNGFLSNLADRHAYYLYRRFKNRYLTLFSFLFSQFLLFFKLLRFWRKDVTIYVNTMLPFGAGLAGWLMKKPVIYHIHETCITPPKLKTFLRKIIELSANKVIYVSNSVKLLESFNNKTEITIYNCLKIDFQTLGFSNIYSNKYDGVFNVLMISSMKGYKGVFEFLKIADQLHSKSEIKLSLVLNASNDEISEFFKNLAIPSNVSIHSQTSNIIPFYKSANLVLNLSRPDQWIETFGLTVIEALAFGIPVIVPPVGGPAEIISDGKEGYLISSYNTEQIAQQILELSDAPEKCYELSSNAKLRASDFNEEKFNQAILDEFIA